MTHARRGVRSEGPRYNTRQLRFLNLGLAFLFARETTDHNRCGSRANLPAIWTALSHNEMLPFHPCRVEGNDRVERRDTPSSLRSLFRLNIHTRVLNASSSTGN